MKSKKRITCIKVYTPPQNHIEPAFAENNIPVFFGCDDKFIPHAAAVMASIMEHASPQNNYDILVVQSGASPTRMAEATEWISHYPNASLRFVDIAEVMEDVGGKDFHTTRTFSLAVYFRLFAQSVFSRYEKIVYLDSDLVLFTDVAELFHQDLEGKLLAACHDLATEQQSLDDEKLADFWRKKLDKEPGSDYFNSGVLVMDLAGMRREGVETELLKKIRSISDTNWPDQDVMNSVMNGRVKYMDCEWNFLDWMADPDEDSLNFLYISREARDMAREARSRIKILHYAERKPWTLGYGGKNDAYYWHYAAMTPFINETRAKLNSNCGFFRLTGEYAALSFQTLNYRLRAKLKPAAEKQKYIFRIHKLGQRKKGVVRHMRRMGYIS